MVTAMEIERHKRPAAFTMTTTSTTTTTATSTSGSDQQHTKPTSMILLLVATRRIQLFRSLFPATTTTTLILIPFLQVAGAEAPAAAAMTRNIYQSGVIYEPHLSSFPTLARDTTLCANEWGCQFGPEQCAFASKEMAAAFVLVLLRLAKPG